MTYGENRAVFQMKAVHYSMYSNICSLPCCALKPLKTETVRLYSVLWPWGNTLFKMQFCRDLIPYLEINMFGIFFEQTLFSEVQKTWKKRMNTGKCGAAVKEPAKLHVKIFVSSISAFRISFQEFYVMGILSQQEHLRRNPFRFAFSNPILHCCK